MCADCVYVCGVSVSVEAVMYLSSLLGDVCAERVSCGEVCVVWCVGFVEEDAWNAVCD